MSLTSLASLATTTASAPSPRGAPVISTPAVQSWQRGTWPRLEAEFECEELLGAGAFAEVYLGSVRETRMPVALKLFPKAADGGAAAERDELEGPDREIAFAELALQHPCVVDVVAVVHEEAGTALAMELMSGGSLRERLDRRGRLPEDDSRAVMRRVIEGVAALHARGVVHRDIKPDNILFGSDLELECKLADFGLCHIGERGKVLAAGSYGSPTYMAPEVAQDAGPYDCAADLWSCGVVLYEMLSGTLPFYGRTVRALIRRTSKGKVSFSQAEWAAVSSEAKSLVRVLLSVNPRERSVAERLLRHPWLRSNASPQSALKGRFNVRATAGLAEGRPAAAPAAEALLV